MRDNYGHNTRRSGRRGAVLLEVVIAMTILAVAGVWLLAMASHGADSLRIARERERELRAANAFFSAVALWTREDLDRHLGTRPQGPWKMHLDRPAPTLYVVELRDSLNGATVLRTSLYRPRHDNDAR